MLTVLSGSETIVPVDGAIIRPDDYVNITTLSTEHMFTYSTVPFQDERKTHPKQDELNLF